MTGAEWIWYNGDFELYHSIKMHNRREEFDCPVPPFLGAVGALPERQLRQSLPRGRGGQHPGNHAAPGLRHAGRQALPDRGGYAGHARRPRHIGRGAGGDGLSLHLYQQPLSCDRRHVGCQPHDRRAGSGRLRPGVQPADRRSDAVRLPLRAARPGEGHRLRRGDTVRFRARDVRACIRRTPTRRSLYASCTGNPPRRRAIRPRH